MDAGRRARHQDNVAPKNERPVRGDTRTGQAIWGAGVDGRSRRIQPRWGGVTAPTLIRRGGAQKCSMRWTLFLGCRPNIFQSDNASPDARVTDRRKLRAANDPPRTKR